MLVLGGHGTLEVTLRCLIERNGMVAITSHWTSKNLKSEVCFSTVILNLSFPHFEGFHLLSPVRIYHYNTVISMTVITWCYTT